MPANGDRVRLDVGLEGGSALTVVVPAHEADSLEQRLRQSDPGVAELDTEDGRVLVVLAHVLYVRRHVRGSRVGFSAAP